MQHRTERMTSTFHR